jgi:biopolymer transport protein TolR
MSMTVGGGEGGYVADINVTPMVVVMLVLLIIFMVIAHMLQSGVSVALPKSKYPDPDPNIIKDTSAVVAIPNNGEYYIGRDKIALVDIPQRVKTILKDKPVPDQVVYVKSSKGVKYGEVVAVIDSIREAGFDRIGLVAEKEKQQGAPSGSQ